VAAGIGVLFVDQLKDLRAELGEVVAMYLLKLMFRDVVAIEVMPCLAQLRKPIVHQMLLSLLITQPERFVLVHFFFWNPDIKYGRMVSVPCYIPDCSLDVDRRFPVFVAIRTGTFTVHPLQLERVLNNRLVTCVHLKLK
jgi:hypothetical protein